MPGTQEVNWGPDATLFLEMSWTQEVTSPAEATPPHRSISPGRGQSHRSAGHSQSLSGGRSHSLSGRQRSIVSETMARLALLKQVARQTRSQVSGSFLPAW